MQHVHIVTDSCAHFTNPHFVQQHPVTVIPNKVTIGSKTYREGVDLSAEDAFRLMAHQPQPPLIQPPTEADFLEAYRRVSNNCEAIVSIHASREIYPIWQRARSAAQQMAGSCKVVVIDSQTLSAAQAMLVRVAVNAIQQEETLDGIVSAIRGAAERTYSVYYVETMTYLLQNNIMAPSHTILGSLLGIKPFITIEEGKLTAIEKVRTRVQAVERLVEFAVEFTELEEAVILQHKPFMSEQTRMLQDRLAIEFPGRHFPYTLYGPSLAALIGLDATGLVMLESPITGIDDDY
jgi:DegV family protein with EDD domain